MSPSSLKAFGRQPSRWRKGWNPPESKAQRWGKMLDCRVLTPNQFLSKYAPHPPTYRIRVLECPECGSQSKSATCKPCKTKRAPVDIEKPWRFGAAFTDAWLEEQESHGREAISETECDDTITAGAALYTEAGEWIDACDTQVLVSGEYTAQNGLVIPVSCLIDFAPRFGTVFEDMLGDLKTCNCAHHIIFGREAFKYGYHLQAAFDLDLYNAATGQERTTWAFLIQESFSPWEVNRCIYGQELEMGNPGLIEMGRMQYTRLLELYADAVASGHWPRYNDVDKFSLADGGWVILRPEPFQAERAEAMQFVMPEEETEEEETNHEHEPEDVPN